MKEGKNMSLATDFLLQQYEKIKCLHRTAKSEVWLASDPGGRLVVMKRIALTGLPYAELKKLSHHLWPRVLYAVEEAEETLVVEEFVQGEPLSTYIQQEKYFNEAEIKTLLWQLCDGLSVLHAHGILHRDIKPSNLIVQKAGTALELRLIDFDAARTVKAKQREDTRLLGTKGYAPPEQYGYEQTDARSDIYALGKTFLEVLNPNYHGYLREVLQKCTEVDPKHRYASVEALERDVLHGKRNRRLKRIGKGFAALAILFGLWTLYRELQQKPVVPTTVQEVVKEETQKIKKPAEDAEQKIISIWQPKEKEQQNQPTATAVSVPTAPVTAANSETATATTEETAEEAPNRIHVAYYWGTSGKALNAWMDNWPDEDFDNGLGTIETAPRDWQNWQGHYPDNANWVVHVRIENQSEETFIAPYLVVRYVEFGQTKNSQILHGASLAPGGRYEFQVPMSQFAVDNVADQTGARYLEFKLKGSGPQTILVPKFKIDILLLEK